MFRLVPRRTGAVHCKVSRGRLVWQRERQSIIIMGNDFPAPGSGQPYGSAAGLAAGARVGGARYLLKRILGRGDCSVV
jgi:hypothetical protein